MKGAQSISLSPSVLSLPPFTTTVICLPFSQSSTFLLTMDWLMEVLMRRVMRTVCLSMCMCLKLLLINCYQLWCGFMEVVT